MRVFLDSSNCIVISDPRLASGVPDVEITVTNVDQLVDDLRNAKTLQAVYHEIGFGPS